MGKCRRVQWGGVRRCRSDHKSVLGNAHRATQMTFPVPLGTFRPGYCLDPDRFAGFTQLSIQKVPISQVCICTSFFGHSASPCEPAIIVFISNRYFIVILRGFGSAVWAVTHMSDHNGDSRHGSAPRLRKRVESWPVAYEVSRKQLINQFMGDSDGDSHSCTRNCRDQRLTYSCRT